MIEFFLLKLPEQVTQKNIHALFVHFPIALIPTFLILYCVSLLFPKFIGKGLITAYGLLIMFLLYLAKITGEFSGEVSALDLVQPKSLLQHATFANQLMQFFSITYLIVLVLYFVDKKKFKTPNWLKIVEKTIVVFFLFISVIWTIKTGHEGAMLVYQQGAGVEIPTLRLQKEMKRKKIPNS